MNFSSKAYILQFFRSKVALGFRNKQIQSALIPCNACYFSTSEHIYARQVVISKHGKEIVVEGKKKDPLICVEDISSNPDKYCSICPNKLGFEIKYTDVLAVSQYVHRDGRPLPRKVTGLCYSGDMRMKELIHKSQRAGLIPEYQPPLPDGTKQPADRSNYKWKKYNTFFDDGPLPYRLDTEFLDGSEDY